MDCDPGALWDSQMMLSSTRDQVNCQYPLYLPSIYEINVR